MGQTIHLNTSRPQTTSAYLAEPAGRSKGGIVVIQEIFGVTAHIQRVADHFAELGYTAIAPAFFDRLKPNLQLAYDQAGLEEGKKLVSELGLELPLEDVAAAAQSISHAGKVGTVGYCWGGTVALLAALRLGLPSVSYYGSRNVPFLGETPKAPVMFHFGEEDKGIPPDMVEKHRQMLPQMDVYTYPANHAFNRDEGPQYASESAKLALERTMSFFEKNLAA